MTVFISRQLAVRSNSIKKIFGEPFKALTVLTSVSVEGVFPRFSMNLVKTFLNINDGGSTHYRCW